MGGILLVRTEGGEIKGEDRGREREIVNMKVRDKEREKKERRWKNEKGLKERKIVK